ncbi:MAG: hypothetical protein IT371_31290 [Deltaproteobacteria bacterium]|nr:hypothetical protein [Deltaproteobacteria bacterium]
MGLGLALGLALLCGCNPADPDPDPNKHGIPQPDPIPNARLIGGTGLAPGDETTIDLLGRPGAVAGPGVVEVRGKLGIRTAQASLRGAFLVGVRVLEGELLEIRYKTSAPVTFLVRPMPIMAPPGPDPLMTEPPISRPAGGQVTIRGRATAGATLLAVNTRTTDMAFATAAASGAFQLVLPAQTGDEVRVYGEGEPLSPPWILTVP